MSGEVDLLARGLFVSWLGLLAGTVGWYDWLGLLGLLHGCGMVQLALQDNFHKSNMKFENRRGMGRRRRELRDHC